MSSADDFDLLVLGGGMAGMSAAAESAQRGARVLVCEVADRLGGTAVLSTGNVWTVPTADAFRAADPDGEVGLWSVVREHLEESLDWIDAMGVPVRERHKASSSSTYDPPPIGRNVDIESYVARSRRAVERAGGLVLNGTTLSRLNVTDAGVSGGRIRTMAGGAEHDVGARGVVLASGGFQAGHDLRRRFLGKVVADSVAVRSNPNSAGQGLLLALEAGAATTSVMDTFYGVILAALPGEITEADYRGMVIHSAVYGLVISQDGTRVADESAGAVPLANAVARSGRAALVVGRRMVEEAQATLGVDLAGQLAEAGRRGVRFAAVESVPALASTLARWGFDGERARATLEGYEAAVGAPEAPTPALTPPRRRHRFPLGGGEVLVLEIQAAITSTFGGIRTDAHGQAQTQQGEPFPGLFAAGVDQGGYNISGYAGGLSRALVFGRRAAERALENPDRT